MASQTFGYDLVSNVLIVYRFRRLAEDFFNRLSPCHLVAHCLSPFLLRIEDLPVPTCPYHPLADSPRQHEIAAI